MRSKINLTDVFSEHKNSLKVNGKYLFQDRCIFVVLPIITTIVSALLLGIPTDRLTNIFSTILSIFIGMFLNLLALIVTFSKNNNNVNDIGNRTKLIKETFSNTCYTIILSINALAFLLLTSINIDIFHVWNVKLESNYLKVIFDSKDGELSIVNVVCWAFSVLFYWYFSNVVISLLMIVKRIYKIFRVEIEYASRSEVNPYDTIQFEEKEGNN
jgi:hypothetical protein